MDCKRLLDASVRKEKLCSLIVPLNMFSNEIGVCFFVFFSHLIV